MSKKPFEDRVKSAFLAYKKVCELEINTVLLRDVGRFGIFVHNDYYATRYQQRVSWRKEVIEAFFEQRKPNPYAKKWFAYKSS